MNAPGASCPACGHVASGPASFCGSCGAALPASTPVAAPGGSRKVLLLSGVSLAALIGVGVALAGGSGGSGNPAGGASKGEVVRDVPSEITSAGPTTSAPASTTTSVATPTTVGPGTPYTFTDLATDPGLSCGELRARGVSYADAIRSWYRDGAPESMDADADGVPCEDDYPQADIDAWWAVDHPDLAVETLARRLRACGYDVTHVVAIEDFPDGTHDVTAAIDTSGDGAPDVTARFNVYTGFDVYPVGDDQATGEALLACRR
ncbi:MAG TPA: hypothetical protein VI854_01080 [Acidimicrobiia bacterium]|nr:hypothetical protein [Acidimicrobiia bacterium]